jgi:pilus assembly protein CpaB
MLVLAAFSLLLSGVVNFVAYRMLRNRLVTKPTEEVQIVVATQKLSLGTRLTTEHLRSVTWPKSATIEGGFSDAKELVGRGVIFPIAPSEPILESKLAPKQGGSGLSTAIPDGMRAVSIRVNEVIGVAGFVLPGTRVDVILIGTAPNGTDMSSNVILENVQVLTAGQEVEQDVQGKPKSVTVVTLLLTPTDSEKLALATVGGTIQLVLRNPMDLAEVKPLPVQRSALYGKPTLAPVEAGPKVGIPPKVAKAPPKVAPPPPPPIVAAVPAPPPVFVVELIQGGKRESHTFTLQKKEP